MDGVLYVTDGNNKKRYIQIDLEKYGSIIEDIIDILAIETRKNEETIPLEEVLQTFNEDGNLDKYV